MTTRPIRAARAPRPVLLSCALAAVAAVPAAAQELPNARELIDKHVQVIGGRTAVLAHQSSHITGTFSMASMGMNGSFEIWTKRPDLLTSTIEVAGIGQVRRGYDGVVGWSLSPVEGPRVVKDAELVQLKDETNFLAAVRDTSLIANVTTVEQTEMGGKACYLVRLEWKSGRESFDCYSVESGLLIASRMTTASALGSVETTTIFEQYQQFGRFRMPTVSRQQLMGTEQVIRVQDVEFDSVADSVFVLPPAIKALVGG